MEVMIRCSAAALLASSMCLLIKRTNPELSLALSAAVTAAVMMAALKLTGGLKELTEAVKTLSGAADGELAPMLKCVGIAAVTKITAELCKEASQPAAASSLEIAGTICAAAVAAPMIISMLKLIGDMV